MGALKHQYPQDLGKVIDHAKRLMKVLTKMERSRADAWFLGRSAEVRGVVSLALADWRSGASDTEKTGNAITSYLDALHRGASKKLHGGLALECCEADDVITARPADEAVSVAGEDTSMSATGTLGTNAPTAPAGWVDSPEMLARVRGGLGLVEMNARTVVQRIGGASATMDDLRAFGREGLLDAARAFDESRGVAFDQWASLRIRSAMIDGVRRWGPIPARARRELRALEAADSAVSASDKAGHLNGLGTGESSDFSTGVLLGASPGDMPIGKANGDGARLNGLGVTPEDAVAKAQLASIVRGIVGVLPKRARELIERIYFDGQTVEKAAASMGASRSWATRVHARAIETMEGDLRKHDRVHVVAGGRPWAPKKG